MPIGARLREERERLGLSQPKFAAIAGTTKQTLFSWETGKTAPDGFQMALFADAGVDVLYVLTGRRASGPVEEVRSRSEKAPAGIDEELMRQIVTMLAQAAKDAGRRWNSERLMKASVDVYKFLAKEEQVDDDKLRGAIRLVVNR